MEQLRDGIGHRLRQECIRLQLSATEAAQIAGCSRRTWHYWEEGNAAIKADALALLCQAGFDLVYVVLGERRGRSHLLQPPRIPGEVKTKYRPSIRRPRQQAGQS